MAGPHLVGLVCRVRFLCRTPAPHPYRLPALSLDDSPSTGMAHPTPLLVMPARAHAIRAWSRRGAPLRRPLTGSAREVGRVRVTAAEQDREALAVGRSVNAGDKCGEGGGGAVFDDHAVLIPELPPGVNDRLVCDEHTPYAGAGGNLIGDRAGAAGAKRVNRDAGYVNVDWTACCQSSMQRRDGFGLDRDDSGATLESGRNAGHQAAATDRDDDRVNLTDLLQKFERERALPGADLRLVVGMAEQRPGLGRPLRRRLVRLGVFDAVLDHSGAKLVQLVDLHRRRGCRYVDLGRHVKLLGRVRDGGPGIATRSSDHALGWKAFGLGCSKDAVKHPARLERARVLHELQLQPYGPSGGVAGRIDVGHWGATDPPGDPAGRGLNVAATNHCRVSPESRKKSAASRTGDGAPMA